MNRTSSGALALAAMLALGVGGCASWSAGKEKTDTSANPRGVVVTTADAAINAKVKTALLADEMVKARNIDVDTVRGVVTLNGTVHSAAEKAQAIKLARNIDGVVQVKDNLKTGG
ncbi:MAG TPA: BON domain-containing protein [Usitatibacter sp.]|nr:BON domain-containing protein [Usitatibacter sp.]